MKKINAQTAEELTKHYDAISDDAFDLLLPKLSPADYLTKLMEKEYFADSIIFLAHALPKREAIWWACLCSKAVTNKETKADDLASLTMAEKWVYEPDDKKRRMCGTLAEKGEYKSAQNWTAAAVFWSGGSITKEEEPAMEPAPYLYAHAVSGSILNAVGMSDVDDIDTQFQQFIKHGLNIADGGNG
jgi:Family of unknown function (DUF6931)